MQAGSPRTREWLLIVEKEEITRVDSIMKGIAALIACYYAFNIAYPSAWKTSLLFLEKKLFGIKSGPNFSKTQLGFVSDIENIVL